MYSDGQVIHDCESMIVTCTGPATATACRFLSRRVQRPVAAGCNCTPKYPCLFRGAALILGVASFLDGATACRCTPPLRGARAENSSSRMGLNLILTHFKRGSKLKTSNSNEITAHKLALN